MAQSNEESALSPDGPLAKQIKSQRIQPHGAKSVPVFYRNIEEALDARRATQSLFSIAQDIWQTNNVVDFASNDYLSWNTTGLIRSSFLEELSRYPDFRVGASASRVSGGNYPYLDETELEIATFHGAEAGLLVNSAFDANVMVWAAIPRPGDVIMYDSSVHASTHEGMDRSLAIQKVEFQHNDIESFRKVLMSILDSYPMIKQSRRSVLIAAESLYSMEGDFCPLTELVEVVDEISQGAGNVQFVIDETNCEGVIGPNGTGLVCELGLEKEIAVRVHAYSKAMGSCGGMIMCNPVVKSAIVNFSRSSVFSTSLPFPFIAAIRAGHRLLGTTEALKGQQSVQSLVRTLFELLTSHSLWPIAQEKGLLSVPLSQGWDDCLIFSHIVAIWTRQKYLYWLYIHLVSASFSVLPVKHPIVPIGESRIRVTIHAGNTTAQVERFVEQVFVWVEEILAIEDGRAENQVTRAAREVYSWMNREGCKGYGMV